MYNNTVLRDLIKHVGSYNSRMYRCSAKQQARDDEKLRPVPVKWNEKIATKRERFFDTIKRGQLTVKRNRFKPGLSNSVQKMCKK
jgi:hypothetical protein